MITNFKYFSYCVDNFFENPNLIREWALKQEFKKDEQGQWPGERTKFLHEINRNIFDNITQKILKVITDDENVKFDNCKMTFQKIKQFSNKENSFLNTGWIHQDDGEDLAGLIYLTPGANIDAGTSLFSVKEKYKFDFSATHLQTEKVNFYKNNDLTNYKESIEKNKSYFDEIVTFKNIYNRCIIYDSSQYHRANNFFVKDDDRLTLVFFFRGVKVKNSYKKIKEQFDNNIKNEISNSL
jgi:hypothetical protein